MVYQSEGEFEVPIAKDESGRYVSRRHARKGNPYFCPDCFDKVHVKDGEWVAKHFSHYSPSSCNGVGNQESKIHQRAKEVLVQTITDWIEGRGERPSFKWTCTGICNTTYTGTIPDHTTEAREEKYLDSRRKPDVLLFSGETTIFAIEVYYTHKVTQEKALEIDVPWIELDAQDVLEDFDRWNVLQHGNLGCAACVAILKAQEEERRRRQEEIERRRLEEQRLSEELRIQEEKRLEAERLLRIEQEKLRRADMEKLAERDGIILPPDNLYAINFSSCVKCRETILVFSWASASPDPPFPRPQTLLQFRSGLASQTFWTNTCKPCGALQIFPKHEGYAAPLPLPSLPPSVLRFFPEGKEPRKPQEKAVLEIENHFASGKDFVLLQGPPGAGKSAIGMTFAREGRDLFDLDTHLITAQTVLQDQYYRDFPNEIRLVKGRSHFACTHIENKTSKSASEGYCRTKWQKGLIEDCLDGGTVKEGTRLLLPPDSHKCPYYFDLTKAHLSRIASFTIDSFLFQQRLRRFGKRHLTILDECHNAEFKVMQFVNLSVNDKILSKFDIEINPEIKTPEDVLKWIEETQVIDVMVDRLGAAARREDEDVEGFTPKEIDEARSVLSKIETFCTYLSQSQWAVQVDLHAESDGLPFRRLQVRPLFVHSFAREKLIENSRFTLAMSATILDPATWTRNMGISHARMGYVEMPCTFPKENRPIYYDPIGLMSRDYAEENLPRLCAKIQEILERHEGQRGIIHAHSDKMCQSILDNVESPRLLDHKLFPNDKTRLIQEHESRPDSVIVASGMHEGIDLKDDLARFQIIAKMPYPAVNDFHVQRRSEIDSSFIPYQTAIKLVQSYGRAVRHDLDWATTYIIDGSFYYFRMKHDHLLPLWFKEAIMREKRPRQIRR